MNHLPVNTKIATTNHRVWLPAVLLLLLALVCADVGWIHIHNEDTAVLGDITFSAEFGIPYGNYYYRDIFLIGPLMAYVTSIIPSLPWYLITLESMNVISLILIVIALTKQAVIYKNHPLLFTPVLVFLLLLLNLNLLHVHHNRTAFMACISALTIYDTFECQFRKPGRRILIVATYIWFGIGSLIRVEAAVAVLILWLIFSVIKNWNNWQKALKSTLTFSVPALLILLYGFMQVIINNELYYALEPDVEYELLERGNKKPLSDMTNALDSARYTAVQNWMLADVKNVPPIFIRSLIPKPNNFLNRFFFFKNGNKKNANSNITTAFYHIVKVQWQLFLFAAVFVLVAIFFIGQKKAAIPLCLILITGTSLILATGAIKIVPRIVEPLAGMTAIWMALYFFESVASHINNKPVFAIVLLSLFLLFSSFSMISQSIVQSRETDLLEKSNQQFILRINKLSNKKMLVLMGDISVFQLPVFHKRHVFNGKKLVPVDFAQYSDSKEFKRLMYSITGCSDSDFLCRFRFLQNRKQELIIVGNEERLQFFKYYLSAVYHFNFNYYETDSSFRHNGLSVYQLH